MIAHSRQKSDDLFLVLSLLLSIIHQESAAADVAWALELVKAFVVLVFTIYEKFEELISITIPFTSKVFKSPAKVKGKKSKKVNVRISPYLKKYTMSGIFG